ncbi:PadR family transcriptional regulator [Streptomyces hawaiiensis]|uniref:PadR family transcriptional regulator n=1 Tax=Streptomyces hawaiiensis TaxID=67305 RepID=UPI00365E0822
MSIRHGLLALLAAGPRYGSRLRTDFEARTGGTWPLNIGQVYTTLSRLERAELRAWYDRPVERAGPPRDELAIKLVMALGADGVDVREVVEAQRRHVARALHDHVRQRAEALARAPEHPGEMARLLVLEQLVFQDEAEVRWLNHGEARLLRFTRGEEPPSREQPGA